MGIFDSIHEVKTYDKVPSLPVPTDGSKSKFRLRAEKLEAGLTPRKKKEFVRLTAEVVSAPEGVDMTPGEKIEIYIQPHDEFPSYAQKTVAEMTKAILKAQPTKEDWDEIKKNPTVVDGQEIFVEVSQVRNKKTGELKTFKTGEPIPEYGFQPAVVQSSAKAVSAKK